MSVLSSGVQQLPNIPFQSPPPPEDGSRPQQSPGPNDQRSVSNQSRPERAPEPAPEVPQIHGHFTRRQQQKLTEFEIFPQKHWNFFVHVNSATPKERMEVFKDYIDHQGKFYFQLLMCGVERSREKVTLTPEAFVDFEMKSYDCKVYNVTREEARDRLLLQLRGTLEGWQKKLPKILNEIEEISNSTPPLSQEEVEKLDDPLRRIESNLELTSDFPPKLNITFSTDQSFDETNLVESGDGEPSLPTGEDEYVYETTDGDRTDPAGPEGTGYEEIEGREDTGLGTLNFVQIPMMNTM